MGVSTQSTWGRQKERHLRQPVKMPSHKSFRTKVKLAKAQKQNRPIPQWIRLRTGNTIRYNAKRRHWARLASASKRLARDDNRHDVRQSRPGGMVITLCRGELLRCCWGDYGNSSKTGFAMHFLGNESSGGKKEDELCWRLRNGKCGMTIPELS